MRARLTSEETIAGGGRIDLAPHASSDAVGQRNGAGWHALVMVSATIIVAVLNYALNIILGWSLTVEEYGRIGVSQTLIFICLWLISAGLPWVVTRAIGQAHDASAGSAQRAEAWRTYKTARLANIGITVVVVGLLQLAFYARWLPLEATYAPLILVVGITVAALGFGSIPNAGLQGLFRFGPISAIRISEAVVNIVVSVALVAAGFGATGALAGFAVAAALSTGLAFWSISNGNGSVSQVEGWGDLGALRTALPMTLAVFGGVLLTNIDLLAIKFLSNSADSDMLSGAYQVAAVLARAPLFIGTALVATFYPRIAQESGNLKAARELVRWVVMGLLPANLVLSLGAPAVVLFFFPQRYASSALLLAVLALGSACLVIASVLAAVLQARHRVKAPALVMTGAVVAQVAGLLFVVPRYGALGAAIVSAGASALAAALMAWYCRDLRLAPAGLPRYGVALALLAVPTLLLAWLFAEQSRFFVALWVAGSAALYGAGLFALNLVNAGELAKSAAMPRTGPLGGIIQRMLSAGAILNRSGWRAAPAESAGELSQGNTMQSSDYTHNITSVAPEAAPAEQHPDRATDTLVLDAVDRSRPPTEDEPQTRPRQRMTGAIIAAIVVVSLFLNSFRTMEAIDLKSDESTYAIESVSLARVGMTRWNGGPFFVHPPLFFVLEGLYYKLTGVGEGPLLSRLIAGPYTAGVPLLPANTQLTGDSVPNAIMWGRYLNALYGGIVAAIVFLLGSALLTRRLGLLAAALFMLDPYVVWRNHFNYLEGLATIFGALALYIYYRAEQEGDKRTRLRRLGIAGVSFGLALLTKELALLFGVAIVTYWLLFRRTRPAETALPLGIGLGMYMLFPLWAAINGEFQNWWDTRSWLFRRLTGQIRDSGIATDKPGTSFLSTIGVNLPDYWPWFLTLGTALLLAAGFLYFYFRRGLRDRAGEFLTGCVLGTYGFFVIVRLVGGVINEHFFYYLMPFATLMLAYMVLAWPSLKAALPVRTQAKGTVPQRGVLSRIFQGGNSQRGATDPDAPTLQMPVGGSRPRRLQPGQALLGVLLALLAYNTIMWVARYGLSRDDSYTTVEGELANTLPPGTAVVGRDLLDLYLMPKQAVYTFSYLNFIGRFIDPANIRDRAIPYALLNDQSVQERYGGANPIYYKWVYANGDEIGKFNGRLYNTYVYRMDYSRPEQAFNADSLAVGRPAMASSIEDLRYFGPESAFDAKITTRWASKVSDIESIYVDLGQSTSIGRVLLSWEEAFARSYELQISDDAQNWRTFYKTDQGVGSLETIEARATGRYVRLLMTGRGTKYGYSLWELSVYP